MAVTSNILDLHITEIPHKEIIMLNFLLGNLCQINNLNVEWLSLMNHVGAKFDRLYIIITFVIIGVDCNHCIVLIDRSRML